MKIHQTILAVFVGFAFAATALDDTPKIESGASIFYNLLQDAEGKKTIGSRVLKKTKETKAPTKRTKKTPPPTL